MQLMRLKRAFTKSQMDFNFSVYLCIANIPIQHSFDYIPFKICIVTISSFEPNQAAKLLYKIVYLVYQ